MKQDLVEYILNNSIENGHRKIKGKLILDWGFLNYREIPLRYLFVDNIIDDNAVLSRVLHVFCYTTMVDELIFKIQFNENILDQPNLINNETQLTKQLLIENILLNKDLIWRQFEIERKINDRFHTNNGTCLNKQLLIENQVLIEHQIRINNRIYNEIYDRILDRNVNKKLSRLAYKQTYEQICEHLTLETRLLDSLLVCKANEVGYIRYECESSHSSISFNL
jgi:hypothetical protein